MNKEGWFHTPGRLGDRTIDEQWLGLDGIAWGGKTVLDLGCAEGLIAERAVAAGARSVFGVEVVRAHVDVAYRRQPGAPFKWLCADLNTWNPDPLGPQFDIVLMLAILHKLRRPLERLALFAQTCNDLAVIRLPPATGPVIVDERSGFVPYDTRPVMMEAGFRLEDEHCDGPKNEFMSYWRRVR